MYKFLIPLFALALLIGCSPDQTPTPEPSPDSSAQEMPTTPTGYDGEILSGMHTVVLKTSMGNITLEIDADAAPKAATNFVKLSEMGYYNGLTFHRTIPNFMIQGGDPNGNGTGGQSVFGEYFEDEQNDLPMVKGAIAMANRGPNTNGSQFFIVHANATPWLQGRHTVFGRVKEGMDVVDAIVNVPVVTRAPGQEGSDRPVDPVMFNAEVR